MQNIGKFQIIGKLGEGGMGVVYKAYDPLMERYVAVKTIPRDMSEDSRSRDRFLREARAIARLGQHKNIVTVHELFEEAGQTYLVMELLTGDTLEQLIKSGKRVSLEEKLWILMEVCDGLAYAHDNNVIHRDVKPGNIFLSKNRGVKILDFGLAHIAAAATQTLRNVGTPCYMPPEQWLGEEADARTDIFSLGIVAYELFTGQRPFYSDNLAALGLQILNDEPAPVDQLNPAFPRDLSDVIARAIAKKRDGRYANAREMARDLERVRSDVQEAAKGLLELACKGVAELEGLIEARRELFRVGLFESLLDATGSTPWDPQLLQRIRGTAVQFTTNAGQNVDYLGVLDQTGQIQSQLARVKDLLPRLERVNSVLKCAEVEESEGNLEGAMRMATGILSELPSWREAADIVERVGEKLQSETSRETEQDLLEQSRHRLEESGPAVGRGETESPVVRRGEEAGLDPTALGTLPEEGLREKIEALLRQAKSLLEVRRDEKGLVEIRDPKSAAEPDGLPGPAHALQATGQPGSEIRDATARNLDDRREIKQRIAALLAEARRRMESQGRISPRVRALDLDEEPEESFIFRRKAEPGTDEGTEVGRRPETAEGESQATLRPMQLGTANKTSRASFAHAIGALLQRGLRLWKRLLVLALSRSDAGWKK